MAAAWLFLAQITQTQLIPHPAKIDGNSARRTAFDFADEGSDFRTLCGNLFVEPAAVVPIREVLHNLRLKFRRQIRAGAGIVGPTDNTREIFELAQAKPVEAASLVMVRSARLGHVNQTIGVAEAKARLSEVIDSLESGETIIIARNGTPVAELRPCNRPSCCKTK